MKACPTFDHVTAPKKASVSEISQYVGPNASEVSDLCRAAIGWLPKIPPTRVLPGRRLVEVAGIEPASFSFSVGLLRAQIEKNCRPQMNSIDHRAAYPD